MRKFLKAIKNEKQTMDQNFINDDQSSIAPDKSQTCRDDTTLEMIKEETEVLKIMIFTTL